MISDSLRLRLGTTTDAILAQEAGVTPAAIQAARKARGIPAFTQPPDVARTMRQFRATDAEYAVVKAYVAQYGGTESEAIRALIAG